MGMRIVRIARLAWWRVGWGLVARLWCPRLKSVGLHRIPRRPVVLAANHASHADTVVMQLLLARAGRSRVLVAGAADYWFCNRLISMVARGIGAFSFPRSGKDGVISACAILDDGWSVLMYPQGTRSGGPFRPGVGLIAAQAGVAVVPVAIEGTGTLLPKGRCWPRRSVVTVRFMEPLAKGDEESPTSFAARLQSVLQPVRAHKEAA